MPIISFKCRKEKIITESPIFNTKDLLIKDSYHKKSESA